MARFVAIENKQDDIDGKVSKVLASATANTKALKELKSMLTSHEVHGQVQRGRILQFLRV